ncbi:hypothetical protein EHM76_02280 [bacterium]|nr:MAG: hypothetical protein EHM76_02280 [bacterium]
MEEDLVTQCQRIADEHQKLLTAVDCQISHLLNLRERAKLIRLAQELKNEWIFLWPGRPADEREMMYGRIKAIDMHAAVIELGRTVSFSTSTFSGASGTKWRKCARSRVRLEWNSQVSPCMLKANNRRKINTNGWLRFSDEKNLMLNWMLEFPQVVHGQRTLDQLLTWKFVPTEFGCNVIQGEQCVTFHEIKHAVRPHLVKSCLLTVLLPVLTEIVHNYLFNEER